MEVLNKKHFTLELNYIKKHRFKIMIWKTVLTFPLSYSPYARIKYDAFVISVSTIFLDSTSIVNKKIKFKRTCPTILCKRIALDTISWWAKTFDKNMIKIRVAPHQLLIWKAEPKKDTPLGRSCYLSPLPVSSILQGTSPSYGDWFSQRLCCSCSRRSHFDMKFK